MKHQPFEVLYRRSFADAIVEASGTIIDSGEVAMAIEVGDADVIITKAQCMEFFGLMETPESTIVGAAQIPVPRVEDIDHALKVAGWNAQGSL